MFIVSLTSLKNSCLDHEVIVLLSLAPFRRLLLCLRQDFGESPPSFRRQFAYFTLLLLMVDFQFLLWTASPINYSLLFSFFWFQISSYPFHPQFPLLCCSRQKKGIPLSQQVMFRFVPGFCTVVERVSTHLAAIVFLMTPTTTAE